MTQVWAGVGLRGRFGKDRRIRFRPSAHRVLVYRLWRSGLWWKLSLLERALGVRTKGMSVTLAGPARQPQGRLLVLMLH